MICWIHGAYSTGQVFNYMIDHVPDHESYRFEYNTRTPLSTNLENLSTFLRDHNCTQAVGHSLGGVMVAVMMSRGIVTRGTAIASPLAGMFIANFFPVFQLLSDLRSTSPLYSEVRGHKFDDNFLSVVATGFDGGYSDGVVPLWSQNSIKGGKKIKIPTNHYEVMLSPDVARAISAHMFD